MARITASLITLALLATSARADTAALAAELSALRGLRVKKPIVEDIVDREELARRIAARAAEPSVLRATAAEGLALARWGMIPPALDYPALLVALRSEQVVGFYDVHARQLVLARDSDVDSELVRVHEIEHALQDQTFDLQKLEDLPESAGDARRARRALIEGDALAAMIELALRRQKTAPPWADPEVTATLEKSMASSRGDQLDRAPLAVREALMFPYHAGLGFIATLRRRQTWRSVDSAFARPPRSTEQILHPERYQAGDEPIAVELPTPAVLAEWSVGHTTVWGELGFTLFLRATGVDSVQAAIAGVGWGGDRVVTFTHPERPRGLGIARLVWDSEIDAIEAFAAAERALDVAAVGATIDATHTRTRWLSLDGTVAWIERSGAQVTLVIGAPIGIANTLATQLTQ